ncbi:UNVERIFIED_CONTAM: hypothetical protein HDU68_002918 [Siphonaria sp. JEL0065]|nr:hypothetical protein HDU68_002918 [Siphonaria sp. JEL0065]
MYFLAIGAVAFLTLVSALGTNLAATNTTSVNPESFVIVPKYGYYKQGYDWWGWDADTSIAESPNHCAEQTYARGLRIYTWHQDTKVCYFKAPPTALGVTMRLAESDVAYNADFFGAFDVFQWEVNSLGCIWACRLDGIYNDFPPCMVSVHVGAMCYFKFPNKANKGNLVFSGIIPEEHVWVDDRR